MTLAQIILLAVTASMFLIVFALGLETTLRDAMSLFRQPGLFVRSILAMNIIMLGFAVAAALLFDLPPAIKIALVALAVSPVPPILPSKQYKAGGSAPYTIGLLVAAAVVAIVLVPVVVLLLGQTFAIDLRMPVGKVASIVLISVIVPLGVGIALRWVAPEFAQCIDRPVSLFATVLLVIAVLPVLFTAWPAVWALVGNGLVLFLVLFTLIGLAVGHFLGGPNSDNRSVLALATGTRHPGVAIAIASVNFPDQRAVLAVVFYHLVIGAIVSFPYVNWRTRCHAAASQVKARL
jgi:BASS family bile acid:Na+ symporter